MIGAVSAGTDTAESKARVDSIFSEAVRMGIVLSKDSLDSPSEVDLSGLTLPVARAACRHVVYYIDSDATVATSGLAFITGVGTSKTGNTTLREHVQEILRTDFSPPLNSVVPETTPGIVLVSNEVLAKHVSARPRRQ